MARSAVGQRRGEPMTKAQLLAVGSTAGLCPGRTGGMMSDQIVMRDSDEAAQPVTIQAWKGRDGHIYFDESTARYAGSTHCLCNTCGAPTPKTYLKCDACREKADLAKYEAMPRAEWDGEAMLYSEARDQYYSTPDDAADELEEDQTLADLRLVICEPNYVRQLEPDYCCDELPEDGDVPDEVVEAMEVFNRAVSGIVLSWSPGKTALALPDEGHNAKVSGAGTASAGLPGYAGDNNGEKK